MQQIMLSQGWQFRQCIKSDLPLGWLSAVVPGTVHQDLLAHQAIADPFFGLNELNVQWVGETDWLYRCYFDKPPRQTSADKVVLRFDGLDTFATVWLNGEQILTTDNMFIPYRVDVSSLLKTTENELVILFESALRRGKEIEAQHGKMFVPSGESSRAHVRKAQYHYGWDWGPILVTAGIWREVWLEVYEARIADLNCQVDVSSDLNTAELTLTVDLEGTNSAGQTLQITLHDPGGHEVYSAILPISEPSHTFSITNPMLWWPRGYGVQALYRLSASLLIDGTIAHEYTIKLGLRRLRLAQDPIPNEPGSTFLFEINNVPIFCGGANWIPADSFTPAISAARYQEWLELAVSANMVMLRVWGGGIYEDDVFYDLCDELGLLVWQDFMFACALYPANEDFIANVRREAEANIRRLRHHPSIVVWCGNNEDYLVPDWYRGATSKTTPLVARSIYEQLLPELCTQLDPMRPYWPGSPYGGDHPNDQTIGDRHTWEVWHGRFMPYQDYDKLSGRFVSEFGMQALPNRDLIESFTEQQDRFPESQVIDHHNKAPLGPQQLAIYLTSNIRFAHDLDSYIYATQFIQSEALAAAYSSWRRRWGASKGYAVSGALVWQLNDCWPVTSWAIVDYHLDPKPAYYTVRRQLAPLVLGIKRVGGQAEIWGVNGTLEAVNGLLTIHTWTLDGHCIETNSQQTSLVANQATELAIIPYALPHVIFIELFTNQNIIARASLWPEPFKYFNFNFNFPDPGLSIKRVGAETLAIKVKRPMKGLWLSSPQVSAWSDNMLDLRPDHIHTVTAVGLPESKSPIYARWLGTDSLHLF